MRPVYLFAVKISMMIAMVATWQLTIHQATSLEESRIQSIVSEWPEILNAAQKYLDDGKKPAGVAAVVSITELLADGYLPPGTSDRNSFGGAFAINAVPGFRNRLVATLDSPVPPQFYDRVRWAVGGLDVGGGAISVLSEKNLAAFKGTAHRTEGQAAALPGAMSAPLRVGEQLAE
jgi:hypothetical protein